MLRAQLTTTDDGVDDVAEHVKPASYWVLTRAQLDALTAADRSLQGVTPEEPAPKVARLYVQYTRMIKQLDALWSETFQVQKNEAMRRLLDAAVMRLAELRDALTLLDISEFHYIDNALIELKLVPRDLELFPLELHPLQREEQLEKLAKMLYRGERIYTEPDPDAEEEQADEVETTKTQVSKRPPRISVDPKELAKIEAIKLIQRHERARVGRLEYFDEKTMFDLRKSVNQRKAIPVEIGEKCAIEIQRLWRGYRERQSLKKRYTQLKLAIGMEVPSCKSTKMQDIQKELTEAKRLKRQEKIKEFIEARDKEHLRVVRMVGPGLMEDIGDEIRWWFRNWYDVAKAFDKYPPEASGGTIIVIRGETMTPEEYRIEQERIRREKERLKNNPELAKKQKADEEKKKKEAAAKAKKEKELLRKAKLAAKKNKKKKAPPEPFSFKESPALNEMNNANKQFNEDWTSLDEEMVQDDEIVLSKITDKRCYELQLEVRKVVDDMMRLELQMLEDAHALDRAGGKGKKKKDAKKKKKKGKKGKKGKKAKKDPTGNRAIEDLFQELYDNDIICKYPAVDLNTYFGEYGYKNMELRAQDRDPLQTVGDIKQVIIDTCIIPLGGSMISKPKSVCICGPRLSGKLHLVNAICTAVNAVMFDLSSTAMAGKYPGKQGLKMFVHLVNKMSRILQPSVLFIDGAEKTFYKKVPKAEKDQDPKRLKGQLFKGIVKTIQPQDRIMLIGISGQPWNCAQIPLLKAYEKFIMIPRTDYGTVYQLWMDILMEYHGIRRDIDVSALAKVSVGYPVPYIREIANKVLCTKRMIRLKCEPLRQHEVLEALMRGGQPQPVTIQEQDKLTNWYNKKTKLGKQRTTMVQAALERRLAEEAAQQKKKK